MNLDIPTLMAAGSFVAALSGAFLMFVWAQSRDAIAAAWWGSGHLLSAAGIAIILGLMIAGRPLAMQVGTGVVVVGVALIWTASARLHHRMPSAPLMSLGPIVALLVMIDPAGVVSSELGAATGLAIIAGYLGATARELWLGRGERLSGRWPLFALVMLHAFVFVGGTVDALSGMLRDGPPPVASWFGLIHFESLLFAAGSAFYLHSMIRARREAQERALATIDSLTHLSNRGAFMKLAEAELARAMAGKAPVSAILFDLDHFKRVNDVFGHAIGDRVLRRFADTARAGMRRDDIIGRVGGEEFAALLPAASPETAAALADRVRSNFAASAQWVDGLPVNATCSAGVAGTAGEITDLSSLLARADQALYRAKAHGRNRIATDSEEPGATKGVVRIA